MGNSKPSSSDYGKKKPCGKWKEWKGPDARRHSRHNLNLHPKFQCANFLGFYSFYLRLSNSERVRSVLSIASLISFVKILLHMHAACMLHVWFACMQHTSHILYMSHSVHLTFCTCTCFEQAAHHSSFSYLSPRRFIKNILKIF